MTTLTCVKKPVLSKLGYRDLIHWMSSPNNIYIGRGVKSYVVGSKWQNPFQVQKYGRHKCIQMYREYILSDTTVYNGKTLLESLGELQGKNLGCWCHPAPCHGDVLIELLTMKRDCLT